MAKRDNTDMMTFEKFVDAVYGLKDLRATRRIMRRYWVWRRAHDKMIRQMYKDIYCEQPAPPKQRRRKVKR